MDDETEKLEHASEPDGRPRLVCSFCHVEVEYSGTSTNVAAALHELPDGGQCPGTHKQAKIETVEHAQLYAGGGMLVWPDHPELLRIFPLAERIQAGQRGGGRVFRRRVIVLEDWVEMPRG